ncbi:MAG TPA: MnmC family methyltransferase [Kofleriaceae bacterium]|nr:MnmC family methyltransferase [Kofleriaceae bacterium]
MAHEVVRTRAGALAVRSVEAGEIMHPGVGPLVEADALYVRQSRLAERLRAAESPLVLFDVGLGAGSNALAARAVSEAAPPGAARLELVSFERDLGALALALDHAAAFGLAGEPGDAARALLAGGRHETARTLWRLDRGDLSETLSAEPARAHLVYWDPFSPRANPALWTIAAFSALRAAAAEDCTVITYSASTATRVALLLAGWAVGVGDPIGDKAQTTIAATDARALYRPLPRAWLSRLRLPSAPMPADAPTDAAARAAAAPQFASG